MNLAALQEAADCISSACLAVENRSRHSVQVHLEDSRLAAALAFPAGSAQSLNLLAVVAEVESEARAEGLLEAVS